MTLSSVIQQAKCRAAIDRDRSWVALRTLGRRAPSTGLIIKFQIIMIWRFILYKNNWTAIIQS